MTNKETLEEYATRHGFTVSPQDAQKIRNSTSNDIVQFRFAACGHKHGHGTQIKNLKNSPKPVECKKCERTLRVQTEKGLVIDYTDHQLQCCDCERVYQRDERTLIKSLREFNCYCKMKRENEAKFYDALVECFGLDKVRRSFSGYETGKNNSGDFTILFNDKTFVIDLDDSSHNCKKNQESDVTKIKLALELGYVPIHVEQSYFLDNQELVLGSIEYCVENCEDNTVYLIHGENTGFYDHITSCEDYTSQFIYLEDE